MQQDGGLLRLGKITKSLKEPIEGEPAPGPVWLVDCGNFASNGHMYPEMRAKSHLAAMALAGCVAVVPGQSELALEEEQAKKVLSESPIPVTSCNLKERGGGLLFEPVIEIADGWFVIGVTSKEPSPSRTPPSWWELADPVSSVKAALDSIDRPAKVVVVGCYQSATVIEEYEKLDVDVVVGWDGDFAIPQTKGALIVDMPAPRGSALQLVSISRGDGGSDSGAITLDPITVSPDWEDDPAIKQLLRDASDERNARLKEEREKLWGQGGFQNIDWGSNSKYLPDVEELPEGALLYVGANECAKCHMEEYRIWDASLHSHAYLSLKESGDEMNMDCLACHTTGLLEPGGFDPFKIDDTLSPVGCESCHGAGSQHIAFMSEGKAAEGLGAVSRGDTTTCMACHDQFNSPDFDASAYWPLISH